jgi:hypothetical protein
MKSHCPGCAVELEAIEGPNRRPARIWSTRAPDSDPIRSPRRLLSTDEICDTTTTLRSGRFPSPTSSRTLPGSPARCRFDVRAHTTTVVIREPLNTSSCTTTWWMGVARGGPTRVVRGDPEEVAALDLWWARTHWRSVERTHERYFLWSKSMPKINRLRTPG